MEGRADARGRETWSLCCDVSKFNSIFGRHERRVRHERKSFGADWMWMEFCDLLLGWILIWTVFLVM